MLNNPNRSDTHDSIHSRNVRRVRVLVADDHVVVRKGLRALFEGQPAWEVVAEAGDGREAIEMAAEFQPDLIILDITMPELNGLDAIPRILKSSPSSHVLILSMHDEEELIQRTLGSGANGYVLKSDAEQSLLTAAEAVLSGRKFVSPSITRVVLNRSQADELHSGPGYGSRKTEFNCLTKREQEVIQLLAEGKSNKQVADSLSISVRTAENHRARLMKKLGVGSLSGLVRYAVRNNIIQP
jgi:DNA-binding NarL/FixJ family response regulator